MKKKIKLKQILELIPRYRSIEICRAEKPSGIQYIYMGRNDLTVIPKSIQNLYSDRPVEAIFHEELAIRIYIN